MIVAAMLLALGVANAFGYQSVVVNMADGTSLAIQGSQGMTASIADGELRFMNTDETFISLQLNEVKGWEFSSIPGDAEWSALDCISGDAQTALIRTSDALILENLPAGSHVRFVSLSGIAISAATVSGTYSISLAGISSGVYMLTYNNKTVKIAVSR